jgi:hypothetical protein
MEASTAAGKNKKLQLQKKLKNLILILVIFGLPIQPKMMMAKALQLPLTTTL